MSDSVSGSLATLTPTGVVSYDFSGRIQAEVGSEVPASTITGQIEGAQIEALEASKITGKLTNEQIQSIEAAKLTGTITEVQIANGAISTPKLAAGAVTTAKLAAGAVTAETVAAGAIVTEKLAAGAVTAAKMAIGELSAISANLGAVTAGTITGATFRTSAANPKVAFDSTGFYVTDSEGNKTTQVTTSGLTLPESGEVVKSSDAVRWVTSKGNPSAAIFGQRVESNFRRLVLEAGAKGSEESHGEILVKVLRLTAPTPEWKEKVLLRKNEESDFLQLTAAAKRKVAFGTFTLEWAGGTQESKEAEVAHGLGIEPAAIAYAHFDNTIGFLAIKTRSKGATSFKANAWSITGSPAAGSKATVSWIAIG